MDSLVVRLDDTLKGYVLTVQEFAELCAAAFAGAFRRPWYLRDTLYHMDQIGVGSLFIVLLTGIFTGMVLALQGAIQLEPYGAVQYISRLISTSVVRELGPVLDALRAEGTDPIKKLVTPRLVASVIMVPVLTVITNGIALLGGFLIAHFYLSIDPYFYWTWAFEALRLHDLIYGLIKPIVFGFIICMVGCYAGLNTAGGTVGVGQSTTRAMVTSSILILRTYFYMTKVFVFLG